MKLPSKICYFGFVFSFAGILFLSACKQTEELPSDEDEFIYQQLTDSIASMNAIKYLTFINPYQDLTLAFPTQSFSNSNSDTYPAEFSISLTKDSFKLSAHASSIDSDYMYRTDIYASIPYCYIDSVNTLVKYTVSEFGVRPMYTVMVQEVIHEPSQIISAIQPMLCIYLNANYQDISEEERKTTRIDF